MQILCLGSRLVCFAAKGAKTKHRRTERRAKWKPLQQRTFSHACPACPFAQRLDTVWKVFGTVFRVLKNPCEQLCSFSLAPCQRSYACPMAQGLETLAGLGCTIFSEQSYWWNLSWKTRTNNSSASQYVASSPKAISHDFPSVHPVVASVSLPPNGVLPSFPSVHPRQSKLNDNPSIGDAVRKKHLKKKQS